MSLRVLPLSPQAQTIMTPAEAMGTMALTRASGTLVYGRTVPENQIFSAQFDHQTGTLSELAVVLAQGMTGTPELAAGYEDPTYLPAGNPFGTNRGPGLLLTITFPKPKPARGLSADLAFWDIATGEVRTILSPRDVERFGLCDHCDMVKEGEVFGAHGRRWLLFEYADETFQASNLGIGLIESNQVVDAQTFLTASTDGSEHVSTAGRPIRLGDSLYWLAFNRRRRHDWTVSHMVVDLSGTWPQIVELSDRPLIEAEVDDYGPDQQRIAFASCVTRSGRVVELLFHINDNRCARQRFRVA